jgi:hypothetical protein
LYSEYPAKVQTKKVDVTRCEWATEIAWRFYRKSSCSTEADLNCIDLAVNMDPTIMIVGRLAAKVKIDSRNLLFGAKTLPDVISCITF